MAVSKIAKQRARMGAFGCLLRLAALPFALVLLAVLLVIANSAPAGSEMWVLGGLAIVLPTIIVTAFTLLATITIRWRAGRLDPLFEHLGPGKQYTIAGRGWAGSDGARQVNAWFARGPQLEIYVSGDTGALAGVGQDGHIVRIASKLRGTDLVQMGDNLGGGPDLDWVRRWMAAPGVEQELTLLLAEDGRTLRSVAVMPDCVRFVVRYIQLGELDAATIRDWQRALVTAIEAAESIGPPAERQEPGYGARLRTSRGSLGALVGVAVGTVIFIAVLSMCIAGPIVWLG